jgi:hypothetical protein
MSNTFHIYGYTHRGAVRRNNEDHVLLGRIVKNSGGLGMFFSADDDFLLANGMLFAIADGIGGQAMENCLFTNLRYFEHSNIPISNLVFFSLSLFLLSFLPMHQYINSLVLLPLFQ